MHGGHDSVIHEGHGGHDFATAVLLVIPILLLGLYAWGLALHGVRKRPWSRWRTLAFLAGLAMVAVALLPPIAPLAHHDLRVHMLQHLLLGMLGPVGLVLGMPVTLALRTLPARAGRTLVAVLRSGPVHVIAHPVTALILNIGGMAVLYATPLYAAMLESPALHVIIHVHFLAAGCLFSWTIVGSDPAGVQKPHGYRLAVLFVAIALHATLAKAMYAYQLPQGAHHTAREIEQAAQIMYYGGDLSEMLLAVALFAMWPAAAEALGKSSTARRSMRRITPECLP